MAGEQRTEVKVPQIGESVTSAFISKWFKKPGDRVERNQPIASVFARDADGIALGMEALRRAIVLGEQATPLPLISHRITREGAVAL